MTCRREYHDRVRQWIAAPVAAVAVVLFCLAYVSTSAAQANGAPASVTSQGFGGRAINGTPPSVTSLGQNGTAGSQVTFSGSSSGTGTAPGTLPSRGTSVDNGDHRHHHHHEGYPAGYVIGVPYAVDLAPEEAEDQQDDSEANDDADYQGGPTVFDRRGSGADSYIPPVKDVPQPHAANAYASTQDETPRPPTTLVFKDGHEVEVDNYAVVGPTLFDLTPGHARRVSLADLDLEATRRVNDDRGVVFEVPSSPQAN